MRILVVDNFDSFTNSIVNFLKGLADGLVIDVVRNDRPEILLAPSFESYDAIIISPGPGNPSVPADLGISKRILDTDLRPILGVCLGHQAMVLSAGGRVELCSEPMHGRSSSIQTTQQGLFSGLPQSMSVMRYHSWTVNTELPEGFVCDAWSDDGVIMAVRDTLRPRWGVQFHPESICTHFGRAILLNFLREVGYTVNDASMTNNRNQTARLRPEDFLWREIGAAVCPMSLVEAQSTPNQRRPILLESSLIHEERSRFSFIEIPSKADLSITYDVNEGIVREFSGTDYVAEKKISIFDYINQRRHPSAMPDGEPPFEFTGGYMGWLGYELKSETLGVTSHPSSTPDVAFREVTQFFVVASLFHDSTSAYASSSGAK